MIAEFALVYSTRGPSVMSTGFLAASAPLERVSNSAKNIHALFLIAIHFMKIPPCGAIWPRTSWIQRSDIYLDTPPPGLSSGGLLCIPRFLRQLLPLPPRTTALRRYYFW